MEFISSKRTLHLASSEQVLKLAERALIDSGPRTSINLLAASIPLCYQWTYPFLTYWLSSFINYLIKGWIFWYAWSLERAGIILFITWQAFALTILSESFPKPITCWTSGLSLSGETISTKVHNDFTAYILTSISGSFSKCP